MDHCDDMKSEFELERELLINRIELKRAFLNFLKKHSTDENRIAPVEKRLSELEQLERELVLLIEKKSK